MTIFNGDIEMNEKSTEAAVVVEDLGRGGDQKYLARDTGVGVIHVATVGEAVDLGQRQAPLCCGSCCDLLRSCIIVNIVNIALQGFNLLVMIAGVTTILDLSELDDDIFATNVDDTIVYQANFLLLFFIIQSAIGIMFSLLGIIGAAKYNGPLVLITGVWYCIATIICVVYAYWIGIVLSGLFAYPHIALFVAFKKGQIKRETYERERYCCCDGNNRR